MSDPMRHARVDCSGFAPLAFGDAPEGVKTEALTQVARLTEPAVPSKQKEVTPHASEPGAMDELLSRLDALAREPEPTGRMMSQWDAIRSMLLMASRGGSYPRDIFESIIQQFADCCGEAAVEIRRLRATEAEQAARIAAMEAGLCRSAADDAALRRAEEMRTAAANVAHDHANAHERSRSAYGAADKDTGTGRQEGHIYAGRDIAAGILALPLPGDPR